MKNSLSMFILTMQDICQRLNIQDVGLGSFIIPIGDGLVELQLSFIEEDLVMSMGMDFETLNKLSTDDLVSYITMEYDARKSGQRSVLVH